MPVILMIDDDDSIRRMMRRILQAAGHEVIEATDGVHGMKLFSERRPDLVITDIIMPDKEGIGTILDLRRIDPDIAIIAISGGGVDIGMRYLQVAGRIGANATLAKPFMPDRLTELVASVLGGERPQPH